MLRLQLQLTKHNLKVNQIPHSLRIRLRQEVFFCDEFPSHWNFLFRLKKTLLKFVAKLILQNLSQLNFLFGLQKKKDLLKFVKN